VGLLAALRLNAHGTYPQHSLSARNLKAVCGAITVGAASSAHDGAAIAKNSVSGAGCPCTSADQSDADGGKKTFHD
jgi:hypothetical protein